MAKWFAEINQEQQTPDQRAEILAEIAEWKQRMKNADTLFRRARLSESEWEQDVQECEHQIAMLEAKLSEETEIRTMLEITANRLANMQTNWYAATTADKQAFIHSLFSEIIYDLDTRRIVGFKMKPWAESFLQLRVGLEEFYQQQTGENGSEPLYIAVLPEGYEPTSRDSVGLAVATVLWILYGDEPKSEKPASSMIPTKDHRNQEIVRRYLAGERAADLAKEFGISIRHVNRLIRRHLARGLI
jgi:hypothetical protein